MSIQTRETIHHPNSDAQKAIDAWMCDTEREIHRPNSDTHLVTYIAIDTTHTRIYIYIYIYIYIIYIYNKVDVP
jgi:hypothetical protein